MQCCCATGFHQNVMYSACLSFHMFVSLLLRISDRQPTQRLQNGFLQYKILNYLHELFAFENISFLAGPTQGIKASEQGRYTSSRKSELLSTNSLP